MAEGVGLLRVATPKEVTDQQNKASAKDQPKADLSRIANHVTKAFDASRRNQESLGIRGSALDALRTYNGVYSPEKLADIKRFTGSQVYSRLTAVKCRAATAILRDIYLAGDVPWSLDPTPDPVLPEDMAADMFKLVSAEVGVLAENGAAPDEAAIARRVRQLTYAAKKAAKKKAKEEAKASMDYLNDILTEGGFYDAVSEMLCDLPIFDIAIIKGPVVRNQQVTKWGDDSNFEVKETPKMFWERVSPFDVYFSPGAGKLKQSYVIERIKITRNELWALRGVPGYNAELIDEVLSERFSSSANDWRTWLDGERAILERRENPAMNSTDELMDALEYNGYIRGEYLVEWGVKLPEGADTKRDYFTTCWMIGPHVIKVQPALSPRMRPPYYVTSFEKVPGSIYGHGLPNILGDIQDVANATVRALINNLSISSGPQVVVNTDRSAPGADTESLYPWKRWYVLSDPLANAADPPVSFFQPNSNANELLAVYEKFNVMADEVSAIPRYMTGSQRTGGAASTASGLSMLMSNSSKVMQNVAANVDLDIFKEVITDLFEIIKLVAPDRVRGDELIVVRGVTTAVKREQDRVRQLEFLSLTANEFDMQITGLEGRASVLKAVAEGLGLEHEAIISDDAMQQAQQQPQPPGPGVAPMEAPNEAKSSGAPPRMDSVSNVSTV